MAKGTEVELRNVGEKTAIKVVADDQGKVVIATEDNEPLQPSNPGGKLDEYAIHDNEADEIHQVTRKGSPAAGDVVLAEDSENGYEKVRVQIGDMGGGGGASSFLGLSDTPSAYTGARAFLVGVEDEASPDELVFIDPATLPFLDQTAADLLYAALGHTHADFLLKAGGIMSGNIDFSDMGEGLRFWDTDAAYFKAFFLDTLEAELCIGDEALGLGGPPMVRANTPVFRIGYRDAAGDGIGGFASLEMWSESQGGYEAIITSISDAPGDPLDFGNGDHALAFYGSAARPTYGGNELAMLTDVPSGGTYDVDEIPHRSKGTGAFVPIVLNGIAVYVGTGGVGSARVAVRDLVSLLKGGVSSPSYSFNMDVGGQGWIGANADPNAVYYDFDFDNDSETNVVKVRCSDGTTTVDVETYVIIQGTAGGGGP